MRPLRYLLRFYSYVVNALVALAALGMSAVILASPNHTIRLGFLPWSSGMTGDQIGAWLAALGVAGVGLIVLSLAGRLRWLLPLYALGVLYIAVNGLFFSHWQFASAADFRLALWIVCGLLLSVVGSVPIPKRT